MWARWLAATLPTARVALIAYRLEQLEQKVSKHNNLVERTYALEESVALMDERVRVANHRIADLEGHA